jgi:hypothetical protein
MALPKTTKPPAEPVNSEQAAALEASEQAGQTTAKAAAAPPGIPDGPTAGELEERAAEAEDRAAAAETRAFSLETELEELKAQVALLMRAQRAAGVPRAAPIAPLSEQLARGEAPVFDEEEPYGIVVGDPLIGYVQHGHQFARDNTYIATEEHRGSPRAFNPRLIGATKPRPGLSAPDPLADFRDDPRRAQ